jgi:hypothetical protein
MGDAPGAIRTGGLHRGDSQRRGETGEGAAAHLGVGMRAAHGIQLITIATQQVDRRVPGLDPGASREQTQSLRIHASGQTRLEPADEVFLS